MARRNISIPDDLDDRARAAGLNVSALTRRAILEELDRQERMELLGQWLDVLDEQYGAPSDAALADANAWLDRATPVAPRSRASTRRPRADEPSRSRSRTVQQKAKASKRVAG